MESGVQINSTRPSVTTPLAAEIVRTQTHPDTFDAGVNRDVPVCNEDFGVPIPCAGVLVHVHSRTANTACTCNTHAGTCTCTCGSDESQPSTKLAKPQHDNHANASPAPLAPGT